jgi:hypothetical protein
LTEPIKYVAELSHVREVTLLGTADLAYWAERLTREDLTPIERDGFAQVMIIAADSKHMGVKFREVSFSILASGRHDERTQKGAYLLQAFNSCRFFAFCERVFFSTPYAHADVLVSAAFPPRVQIGRRGRATFHTELKPNDATAPHQPPGWGEHAWLGPVFLPASTRHRDGKRPHRRMFFARLIGHTFVYDFREDRDSMSITPDGVEAIHSLVESHFTPREWLVRPDAAHAKSKTYHRGLG